MIHIRSAREIELIRQSCQIVLKTFDAIRDLIRPNTRTAEIDREIEKYINSVGARPAFKGYNGFPASSCISIDEEVVHGLPGNRALKEGDIVSIDIGVERAGFFGDSAKTFAVGEISSEKARLMKITSESLQAGLKEVRGGSRLSNVSHAIQTVVEKANYAVVRELVGHGIGQKLHEDPQVPNFGQPNSGPRLRKGMVLAIEPMVNAGTYKVKTQSDNWTVVTEDGQPSAHFEHTVVVTEAGHDILTATN